MHRRTVLSIVVLAAALVALTVLASPGESARLLARLAAHATGTVPAAPLFGPYTGEDLISAADYKRVAVSSVVGSELETMRMISQLGLARTMEKLREDLAYVGSDGACHGAAHIVGYAAFDLMGVDALQECTTGCFSGCYHGALQRMGVRSGPDAEGLRAKIQELCSSRATAFERDQCYHGAGHGFLLEARYDLAAALEGCRLLGEDEVAHSCYMGVFMENYVGDGSDQRMSMEDLHFPCSTLNGNPSAQDACYRMQPSHFLAVFDNDFQAASTECQKAPSAMQNACFKRLGQLSGTDTENPPRYTEAYCATVPKEYYSECILGGLRQVINFNGIDPKGTAASFCAGLEASEAKRICYADYARQLRDLFEHKEERLALCGLFETPFDQSCKEAQ